MNTLHILVFLYYPIFYLNPSTKPSDPDSFIVMKGRSVILFPDLGAFDQWSEKAEKIEHLANISVSDVLEMAVHVESFRTSMQLSGLG